MHTFRKYISNRGSALFMVISIMTALMITCMAMYFTVVSSRSTTYTIFNQKQSYQNALSIYDMLLNDTQNEKSDFRDMLLGMKVGDEKTTTGSDATLGEYNVTVKRLPDQIVNGVPNQIFDIIVASTINGVTETIHAQTGYQPPSTKQEIVSNPNASISPTFAATGYVPNDVYLDRGRFFSDVYFDNEVTYFGAYDGGQLFSYGDVNCAGSVVFREGKQWNFTNYVSNNKRPLTFAVRNNLTMKAAKLDWKSGDRILVGGDLYLGQGISNASIYVNGDLHITGDNHSGTRFFVNGDVYCNANGVSVWCNGTINGNATDLGEWAVSDPENKINELTVNEMIVELDKRTQTNPYYKWIIKDEIVDLGSKGNHQKLELNELCYDANYIVHKDAYSADDTAYSGYVDKDNDEKWSNGCVLDDIVYKDSNNGESVTAKGYFFLVIDTGDNPDNVYTIRLQANRKDNNGNKTMFSWSGQKGDSIRPIVLVKGRGSVLIDVPAGVVYQDVDKSVLAHYNWWLLSGNNFNTTAFDGSMTSDSALLKYEKLANYVHSVCGSDCKKNCDYIETNSKETCTRQVSDGNGGKKICGTTKKTVKCKAHSHDDNHDGDYLDEKDYLTEVTYCPVCETQLVKDKNDKFNICKDTVDKEAVKTELSKDQYKGKVNVAQDGSIIYPNCNIYLICSDESADFRFGHKLDGSNITKNSMAGYVYAPYATFFAAGGDTGNDAVKYMGGMTVSDYNFYSEASLLMCKPDKNPSELMDDECLQHSYTANKDWKIELITH